MSNSNGKPSQNGANGRGFDGRFLAGNAGGPGNPFAKRTAELRAAMFDAITPEDIRAVIRALVAAAIAGDVPAARLLLDRVIGSPPIDATPCLDDANIDLKIEAELRRLRENARLPFPACKS